ncbi:MAG: hypothetical protein OEZ22_06210 [Spirochaetia bacterium]|nr:hypothetical protein [Spirochaetia bacterium]
MKLKLFFDTNISTDNIKEIKLWEKEEIKTLKKILTKEKKKLT